ncbi:hypothetical protein K474DRAFT_1696098 [Panus rudis PR-1116 ss-1]|nr:hypothetical protein K474DRAFT_1696098 [Panus rudis PR-1116 ss-1]
MEAEFGTARRPNENTQSFANIAGVYHSSSLPSAMARLQYHPLPAYKATRGVARVWAPSLATWSVGAGIAALYVLSVTPLVKRELLSKLPVIGGYWQDKTPASDKPF